MSNNDIRTLLERACAKAVDVMLSGDDVATVRQGTGHHVVTIRTVESEEREARTIQRRVEHAERELSRLVDELAHVRETGAAELARASDALASAAADVDALRAEVTRQTGIAVDHCARADAAEQMVAELRERLREAGNELVGVNDETAGVLGDVDVIERVQTALSRTEAVAGRWVPRAKYDEVLAHMGDAEANRKVHLAERDAAIACNEAMREPMRRLRAVVDMPAQGEGTVVDEVIARLDAAIAARDEAVATVAGLRYALAMAEAAEGLATQQAHEETDTHRLKVAMASIRELERVNAKVCADRAAAERARDEVGIQLAAAQAEIARLTKGLREVERFMLAEWRPPAEAVLAMVRDVAAGGPSVPGDALAPRITAALEASGIDTSNVKGVE